MISEVFSIFIEGLCDPGCVTGLALAAAQCHQAGAGFKVTKLLTMAHPWCGCRSEVTNSLETHFSGPEVILSACSGLSGWSVSCFMLVFNHSLPRTEAGIDEDRHGHLPGWLLKCPGLLDTGSGLRECIFSSLLRCSDFLIQVAQIQGLTWPFPSSRQKSAAYKHVIVEGFHPTGIFFIILIFPLAASIFSSLPLTFSHPEKKTFTLHSSERKSLAEGLHEKPCQSSWTSNCWELAEPGINKQPGNFRMVERATWTCLVLSLWGKNEHFSSTCTLEQMPDPLKPLQKFQWNHSITSWMGGLGTESGSSFASSFNAQVHFRHFHECIQESKG